MLCFLFMIATLLAYSDHGDGYHPHRDHRRHHHRRHKGYKHRGHRSHHYGPHYGTDDRHSDSDDAYDHGG